MGRPKITEGELYVMGDVDFRTQKVGPYVKIGLVRKDRSSEERAKEHQTGNPREIRVLHRFKSPMVESLETHLHHLFAHHWVIGEWFAMDENFLSHHLLPTVHALIEQQGLDRTLFAVEDQLKTTPSDGTTRDATEDERRWHTDYCAAKLEHERLSAEQTIIKQRMLAEMVSRGGITGVLNVQVKTRKGKLDEKALIAAHPDETAPFLTQLPSSTGPVRGTLSVKSAPTLRTSIPDLYQAKASAKQALDDITAEEGGQEETTRSKLHEVLHAEYLDTLGPRFEAELRMHRNKARLANSIGTATSINGLVSWPRKANDVPSSQKLDSVGMAKIHPDLIAKFTKADSHHTAFDVHSWRAYPV